MKMSKNIIPKIDSIYEVEFEIDCQTVDEFATLISGDIVFHPVEKVTEKWKFARVLMIDSNGDFIVEHDTGVRYTYPRIDRISAKYINEYRWKEIKVPDNLGEI